MHPRCPGASMRGPGRALDISPPDRAVKKIMHAILFLGGTVLVKVDPNLL